MDYEFQRDLTGGILARFSMDHDWPVFQWIMRRLVIG